MISNQSSSENNENGENNNESAGEENDNEESVTIDYYSIFYSINIQSISMK